MRYLSGNVTNQELRRFGDASDERVSGNDPSVARKLFPVN